MNKTIIINRRTPITLKDVSVIEQLTDKDVQSMAASYGGDPQDFAAFNSAVRLVDGSTKLAVQTLDDFVKLTRGRVLGMGTGANGKAFAGPLVPIDAIRHLEPVSDDERAGMKAAYGDVDPEAIDAKRTRIVYRALDPANPQRYFQKTFAADILDDLLDRDASFIIDIGGGKFVLADEIEDARPLSEKELARLSRKYAMKARNGEALITSIVLTGDEFILSSLPAQAIETLVERPLPSLQGLPVASASVAPAPAQADPVIG
jgi:hypothetical protein